MNELITWHFDHTVGRLVKGVNLLNCIYHSGQSKIPVAFKLITIDIQYSDVVTQKLKIERSTTKNEGLISMLKACKKNQLISMELKR